MKFRNDKLVGAYSDIRIGKKLWNEKIAKLYIKRVDFLAAAASAHDLVVSQAFGFHALAKGSDLEGKFSLNIDGFHRLIVSFEDAARTIVVIEEVSKHYGE